MVTATMRRRCEALVRRLDLPSPFTVDALVARLSAQRGRPIRVHALPPGLADEACGLWLATDDGDDIYVADKTTAFHREHILLHEIGHLLCDHGGADDAARAAARLLPGVSPTMISRMLARTDYTTHEEQEAELVATLIRSTAAMLAPSASRGARGRLETALGIRGQRP
jgi:hypothetical protein